MKKRSEQQLMNDLAVRIGREITQLPYSGDMNEYNKSVIEILRELLEPIKEFWQKEVEQSIRVMGTGVLLTKEELVVLLAGMDVVQDVPYMIAHDEYDTAVSKLKDKLSEFTRK